MIRLLLVLLLSFSLSSNSSSQDCETVPQVIDTADFVLKKSCSPYTIEKSLVVSSKDFINSIERVTSVSLDKKEGV